MAQEERNLNQTKKIRPMNAYNPAQIEKKYQRLWKKIGIFRADDTSKKEKFYCLDMFPYPSGEGLHVGHPRGYVATDVFSHYMRRKGFNVLHPMGWDAFGLPAENYAIKTGVNPRISTQNNIRNFKRQTKSLGLSYDWSREISTIDPDYYRFTQWIFLMLYKKGLAYEAILPINWCPSCKTGLANEEVIDGKCERCKSEVSKKNLRQWILKITAYAEKLLKGLEDLDWPEKIKEMQRNWIGRSEGWEIEFKISGDLSDKGRKANDAVKVFTTRADTLFGATYLVLAPEHQIIESLESKIKNYQAVHNYIEKAKNKSEKERISEIKKKSGIEINGIKAINPVNSREIPIWIADYVLMHYGTGAIMAVPAHDKRDFDFAKAYNLPIIEVISQKKEKKAAQSASSIIASENNDLPYEGEGVLVNSSRFDGVGSEIAADRIGLWLEKKELARKAVNYKLRDWIFSRQRYWGEPIPIIRCEKCGLVPLEEKDLPLRLPWIEKYKPTGTGESPLAAIEKWVNVKCPKCGGPAKRETNTMPQWAGSCWYYIAYTLGHWKEKEKIKWSDGKINSWLPVNLYVGGAEHAVLHLLYSRFWHKFLYDMKLVGNKEPFLRLKSVGLILGPDGQKMSKSRGNVISPDKTISEYGADTLRLYEMFVGPFSQETQWSLQGIKGCRRFLDRVWQLKSKAKAGKNTREDNTIKPLLHQTIKRIGEEIEDFRFNSAIADLMTLINEMDKRKEIALADYKTLILLLAPFAPHFCEAVWQEINPNFRSFKEFTANDSIHHEPWPRYNEKFLIKKSMVLVIQVNGKIRDRIKVDVGISEEKAKELALSSEKIKKWTGDKAIKNVVFVAGKLVNIVI
ncbi:MAG: leucine--tRNA ligase [bacterium]